MENSNNAQFLRKLSYYGAKLGRCVKSLPGWYSVKSYVRKYRNLIVSHSLFADSASSKFSAADLPVTKQSIAAWLEASAEASLSQSDSIPMILKLQTPQPWISKTLHPISQSPEGPSASNGLRIFRGPFNDYVVFPDMEDPASIQAYVDKHERLSEQYFAQNDFTLGIYHLVLAQMCYPDPMERLNTEAEYLGRNTLTLATNVLQELTLMKKSQFNEDE